jgi:hypothetical protein
MIHCLAKSCIGLFVAAVGFALFGTPVVMAQFASTIVCGFQGSPHIQRTAVQRLM